MNLRSRNYSYSSPKNGQLGVQNENPLMNHLILKEIQSHLCLKDLLVGRQVCKLWRTEFSRQLSPKFTPDSFSSFARCNSNRRRPGLELDNPFRKFDFSCWKDLWFKKHRKQKHNLEFILNQLTYSPTSSFTCIKELKLSSAVELKVWGLILEKIAPTVETLIVNLNIKTDLKTKLFHSPNSISKDENVLILKNLKVLKLRFRSFLPEYTNSTFLEDFLTVCQFAHEIELLPHFDVGSSGETKALLDILIKQPPRTSLERLKLSGFGLMQNIKIAFKIIEFASKNNPNMQIYLNNSINLALEDLLSYYFYSFKQSPSLFQALEEANYQNPKEENSPICSATTIKNSCYFSKRNLNEIMTHFPNLVNLSFAEPDTDTNAISTQVKFLQLKSLEYFNTIHDCFNIGGQLSKLFPNLTVLSFNSSSETAWRNFFNFGLVYKSFKKLQVFKFNSSGMKHSLDEVIVSDTDITGISEIYIKKVLLKKTQGDQNSQSLRQNLKNFNLELLPKHYIGIWALEDLRELEINASSGPTIISHIFGFERIKKLQSLKINKIKLSTLNS